MNYIIKENHIILFHPYLSAEGQIVSQVSNVVFQQVDKALVEGVVFTLHVGDSDHLAQDVFIE